MIKCLIIPLFLFILTACTSIPECKPSIIKYKVNINDLNEKFDINHIDDFVDTIIPGIKCKFY